MAKTRHATTSKSISQPRKHRALSHVEKIRFIKRYEKVGDPTNERAISRRYNQLKRFPLHLARKAPADTRDKLKARGFFVTKRGVFIDGPRDTRRKPIPGARMRINKDATVVWSVKQRRDYIVGLTKAERKEFAKNPGPFIEKKEKELRAKYPTIGKRKIQTRLQWGAYQATKDFSPNVFSSKYLMKWLPREKEHKIDKLTGLHFVVHVPREKGKKHGKRKNRRS